MMKNLFAYLLVFSFLFLGSVGLQAQYTGSLDLLLSNNQFNIWFKEGVNPMLQGSITYLNSSSNDQLTLRAGTGTGDTQSSLSIKRIGGVEIDGDLSIAPYDKLKFGSSTRQMIDLFGSSYGIGIQSNTQYFRTQNDFAWFRMGTHNIQRSNPGTGGTLDMLLREGVLGVGVSATSLNTNVRAHIGGKLQVDGTVSVKNGVMFQDNMTLGDPNYDAGSFGTLNGEAYFRVPMHYEYATPSFAIRSSANVGPIPIFSVKQGIKLVAGSPDYATNWAEYVNNYDRLNVITAKGILNVDSYLHVGKLGSPISTATPDIIDGAVAHFDGRVYISEEDGDERGFTDTAHENYDNYLLWVEEGIVSKDIALADPALEEGWPDFVFEEDYNLSSLTSVADFITQNGHLPTMPSAAEIGEQGYSMHDMNKRLLQTVEELTLHTIAQEKQLSEQQAKLETQQAKFAAQQQQLESLLQRIKQLESSTAKE